MKTTQFYQKPIKVRAWQYTEGGDFVQILRTQVLCRSIEVAVHPARMERNVIQTYDLDYNEISVKLVSNVALLNAVCFRPGDWLVTDDERGPRRVSDEQFKRDFFSVVTDNTVTMPKLDELI